MSTSDRLALWYRPSEELVALDAAREPWTKTGSAVVTLGTGGATAVVTAEASYWRHVVSARDKTTTKRFEDRLEVQAFVTATSITKSAWTTSGLLLMIDDGQRQVGLSIDTAVLKLVNPSDGTELATVAAAFNGTFKRHLRLVKDGSSRWVVFVDDIQVGSIPYQLGEASPNTNKPSFYVGQFDSGGSATFVIDDLEASVNMAVPVPWKINKILDNLTPLLRKNLTYLGEMILRAIVGAFEAITSEYDGLWRQHQADQQIEADETYTLSGRVLGSAESPAWTVVNSGVQSVVRDRLRIAPIATTTFTGLEADWSSSTNWPSTAWRMVRGKYRLDSYSLDSNYRLGPHLEVSDGTRKVSAVLMDTGLGFSPGHYAWVLSSTIDNTTAIANLETSFLILPIADMGHEHEVELHLLSPDKAILIVDGQIISTARYADLAEESTEEARIGAMHTTGGASATDWWDCEAARIGVDYQRRPLFLQRFLERGFAHGGCERNDEVEIWMRHHVGQQKARGTSIGITQEFRRINCVDLMDLVIPGGSTEEWTILTSGDLNEARDSPKADPNGMHSAGGLTYDSTTQRFTFDPDAPSGISDGVNEMAYWTWDLPAGWDDSGDKLLITRQRIYSQDSTTAGLMIGMGLCGEDGVASDPTPGPILGGFEMTAANVTRSSMSNTSSGGAGGGSSITGANANYYGVLWGGNADGATAGAWDTNNTGATFAYNRTTETLPGGPVAAQNGSAGADPLVGIIGLGSDASGVDHTATEIEMAYNVVTFPSTGWTTLSGATLATTNPTHDPNAIGATIDTGADNVEFTATDPGAQYDDWANAAVWRWQLPSEWRGDGTQAMAFRVRPVSTGAALVDWCVGVGICDQDGDTTAVGAAPLGIGAPWDGSNTITTALFSGATNTGIVSGGTIGTTTFTRGIVLPLGNAGDHTNAAGVRDAQAGMAMVQGDWAGTLAGGNTLTDFTLLNDGVYGVLGIFTMGAGGSAGNASAAVVEVLYQVLDVFPDGELDTPLTTTTAIGSVGVHAALMAPQGWVMEETYPGITPIVLESTGQPYWIFCEFPAAAMRTSMTDQEFADYAAKYLVPRSVAGYRYFVALATDITGAGTQDVSAITRTLPVRSTVGFAVDDVLYYRNTFNSVFVTTRIVSIVAGVSITVVDEFDSAPAANHVLRKILAYK